MRKLKLKKEILLLLTIFTMISCDVNNDPENVVTEPETSLLLGNWINPTYNNETITFTKANSLSDNEAGISFKTNNKFTERTSGWCGTPPLSYFDVEGSWQVTEEGFIKINKTSFPENIQWQVLKISDSKLEVKRALTEQEIDYQKLMELFTEIESLSYSETCSNALDWTFVGYGSKACGGFQGYIPYSKNIDTNLLLNKIEVYTNAEKEYNKKFGIVSNCTIISKPKSVECQNGYPTLKY